jgi:hypothetical protein
MDKIIQIIVVKAFTAAIYRFYASLVPLFAISATQADGRMPLPSGL